jgi:hypothetical protein
MGMEAGEQTPREGPGGARSCLASWTFRAFAECLKEANIEVFGGNVAFFMKSAQIARNFDQAGLVQEFDTFRYRRGYIPLSSGGRSSSAHLAQ